MNDIVMIPIDEIYEHPDNPRKNLGDLSELADSIKKNGIMQNLTVVKGHHMKSYEVVELGEKLYNMNESDEGYWELREEYEKKYTQSGYTLIIGHRRCAASRLAGLTELPCVVVELDERAQFSTMLEENMQRHDLTIYEQAQGFQMMLDLGDTEEEIAEKTGFSKTTIKRRLEIAKLDKDVLQDKENSDTFQLSLKDLDELAKIEDVSKRNEILEKATSSRDLVWQANREREEVEKQKKLEKLVEMIADCGIKKAPKDAEDRWNGKYTTVQTYSLSEALPEEITCTGNTVPMYTVSSYDVRLVVKAEKKEEKETEAMATAKELTRSKKELKEKSSELYADIHTCIKCILDGKISPAKETVEIYQSLVKAITRLGVTAYKSDIAKFKTGMLMYDLQRDEDKYQEFNNWLDGLSELHRGILSLIGVDKIEVFGYNADFRQSDSERIKPTIEFLKVYGFSLTDEEQQLIDGTYQAYR